MVRDGFPLSRLPNPNSPWLRNDPAHHRLNCIEVQQVGAIAVVRHLPAVHGPVWPLMREATLKVRILGCEETNPLLQWNQALPAKSPLADPSVPRSKRTDAKRVSLEEVRGPTARVHRIEREAFFHDMMRLMASAAWQRENECGRVWHVVGRSCGSSVAEYPRCDVLLRRRRPAALKVRPLNK